jgi:hypothetical protein
MLSEIGGLLYSLQIIVFLCIMCCESSQLYALLANRLYKDDPSEAFISTSEDKLEKMKMPDYS